MGIGYGFGCPLHVSVKDSFLLLAGMTFAYSSVWLCSSLLLGPREALSPLTPATPMMSTRESFHFMEMSDEDWLRKKEIHAAQLRLQKAHLHECDSCNGHAFWQQQYEPSFSCAFERRIGPIGDGAKWVCDPHHAAQKGSSCLVYSIGSNGEFGFEQAVHRHISPHCQIHIFDSNEWSFYNASNPPPSYVHYHVQNIQPGVMGEIYRGLEHVGRTIDLFKIDCESCEFETYREWFEGNVFIRQILLEVHGPGGYERPVQEIHDLFAFLFSLGYVVFHKEPNTLANNYAEGGNYIEFALLRLSPEFSQV